MSETKPEYKIEGRPATIFRVIHDKDNPYVTINATPILNICLSWKAKGILTYLMSRPDGWEVSIADLVKRSTDGKASVRAGLKELRDAGHMRYTQSRNEGRITGWHIEVFELPQGTPTDDYPTDEIIDEEEPPQVGDTTMRKSVSGGSPESDFQEVENQQIENRTQVLKTLSSIKDSNNIKDNKQIPEISPEQVIFTDHFGTFFGERERKRWFALYDAIGQVRADEIADWAERKEIHMVNRGGLLDSLETAAKKWTDKPSGPKYPGKMKGDNTEFFKDLEITAKKDNPWQPEKRLLVSSDT